MSEEKIAPIAVYQFHVLLLDISPAIWRRFVIRNDQTIADLHQTLQLIMGWSDTHLHRFQIRGVEYGVGRPGGMWFRDDPTTIHLRDLHLRLNERFIYQYDFGDDWRHQVRLERVLPVRPRQTYPRCVGGANIIPPEDCGGAWAYLDIRPALHDPIWEAHARLAEMMREVIAALDTPHLRTTLSAHQPEMKQLLRLVEAARFDRQAINQLLADTFSGAANDAETAP